MIYIWCRTRGGQTEKSISCIYLLKKGKHAKQLDAEEGVSTVPPPARNQDGWLECGLLLRARTHNVIYGRLWDDYFLFHLTRCLRESSLVSFLPCQVPLRCVIVRLRLGSY